MKKVILVGGTMGIGKSTVCHELNKCLDKSVFLDGDWCWNMHPFIVNEETKKMVMNNIVYQLNQFIHCSSIDYVIFGWVMHEQAIIDEIVKRLDKCEFVPISLICNESALTKRIEKDICEGKRTQSDLKRSLARLEMYHALNTYKIDVSSLNVENTVKELKKFL